LKPGRKTAMKTLEEEIRDAMMALENSVPQDYFDEFPGRVDARLEIQTMASDTSEPRDGDDAEDSDEDENTGLHDIKEMAENTKQRISRRISTQSDVEESLLGSSSVGLKAVVLPTPGKDIPKYDTTTPVVESAHYQARGGVPIWAYAAVAAVAAVAVIFFVTRGGDDKRKGSTGDRVAVSETAGEAVAGLDPPAPPAPEIAEPEPVVTPLGDVDPGADGDEAVDSSAADEPAPGAGAAATAPRKDVRRKPAAKTTRTGKPAKKSPTKKADPKKPADPKPAPKPKSPGDQSIEDMLSEASGGAAGPDVDASKSAAKKKPTKTELNARDIRNGMNTVSGKAKSCYSEHQQAGSVGVAVTVSPDGKVTKASPTGAFASGDKAKTGKCVAAAVKAAKFPAWDGKAKSFKYSYLLSD
jgi:hypothetical protein